MRYAIRVTAAINPYINLLLALIAVFLSAMFKKLLLATLIVIIGLWGAGYDVAGVKDDIWDAANKQAGAMTGRARIEGGDWGSDATD